MVGYLLGALMTSITFGLVIVFSVEDSSAVTTTENTLSPAASMALGGVALVVAFVVGTGRDQRKRRRARKKEKGPPRWQQALGRGSPRTTFVVGALLTLPGASYLAGLRRIDKLNYSAAQTVLLVVAFNLVMLALLEIPLVCFAIAPDWTVAAVGRTKAWIGRQGRRFVAVTLAAVGGLLVIKGLIEFVG